MICMSRIQVWSDGVLERWRDRLTYGLRILHHSNTPVLQCTPFSFERMFRRRKFALFHFADKFFHRAEHGLFYIGVALDEFRHEIIEQAEHVMDHQHLTVAVHAGADADGRDG